jgi:hypothetical protein
LERSGGLGDSCFLARVLDLVQSLLSVIDDFLLFFVNFFCPFPHLILGWVILTQTKFMSIVSSTSPDFSVVE